ncbi:peptidylprolyl isomerase [Rathayibacter tanaceti]|uniref:Peptidyl-prolyl cis-trans isomerase B n=2 Tax=Rathayibacter tanaceti TaxID=1671680 RepID=A0A166HWL6_9MICO|nr:peptidylprolyl isomerase [Rathayibacter tanaceti]KZX21266.1 Peptidyl-prolyl cis-trans isomerase B [Rathayibacter tanaceti]QHC55359.1 peptidylprolyl isomerase [Rathayibacter tanaceti]TCO36338.1 peptidyl-prolyl cis-trans isomerase B (cyclophilin B) [Rathayibacter tanaceti]
MAQGKSNDREARTRLRAYQARQSLHRARQRRRVRDNVLGSIAAVVVIALAVVAQLFYFSGGPGTPVAEPTPSGSASATPVPTGENSGDVPSADIAEGRDWTGTLTINDDPLELTLAGASAPQAVSSFISLTQSGFYDGTPCHRLTTEGLYVLQCGDPDGTGTGGPGYSYGPVENAPEDGVYPAGTIAMARQSGNGYSQGSQFFVVYQDTTLPADAAGGYTVIGRVVSGLDALVNDVVAKGTADGSTDGAPAEPVAITSVSVQ